MPIIFHAQPGARNTGDVPAVAAVGGVNEANITAPLGIEVVDALVAVLLMDELFSEYLLDALVTVDRFADTE
ncbi:MAG TPA: hypothetical protein VLC79_02005 [Cellvibrio sp.]|nr:hypothetical protein [Cellvibrio sp.]